MYGKFKENLLGEKIAFENLHGFRKKIEDLRRQAELAEREGDLEKVAKIVYGELPQAEKDFSAFEKKHFSKPQKSASVSASRTSAQSAGRGNNKKTEQGFIKEAVDEKDIAAVVTRWTGIPVSNMLESEAEKLSQKVSDFMDDPIKAVFGVDRKKVKEELYGKK